MNRKVKNIWSSIIIIIFSFIILSLIIRFVFVDNSWLSDTNQKIITEVSSIEF